MQSFYPKNILKNTPFVYRGEKFCLIFLIQIIFIDNPLQFNFIIHEAMPPCIIRNIIQYCRIFWQAIFRKIKIWINLIYEKKVVIKIYKMFCQARNFMYTNFNCTRIK